MCVYNETDADFKNSIKNVNRCRVAFSKRQKKLRCNKCGIMGEKEWQQLKSCNLLDNLEIMFEL